MEENSLSDGDDIVPTDVFDVEKRYLDNVKRLKTENNDPEKSESVIEKSDDSTIEKSDESTLETSDESTLEKSDESKESNNSNCEASTSTSDSGFPKGNGLKSRNYRKSSNDNESSNDSISDPSLHEDRVEEEDRTRDLESDVHYSENSLSSDYSLFSDLNRSNSPTTSTVIPDSEDIGDDDSDPDEEHPILKKTKPKHNWFIVPEITNRQLGSSSKKQSSVLFQRRCYGSLHCVQRLELMYKLEKHEGCVNSLNFSPNGDILASGSDDLKVVLWDWKNGNSLLSFETKHRGNVFQSKFVPLSGDLHIVTCARDGQVRLAQVSALEGLRCSRKLGAHRGPCHKLAILYDQPQIVISVGDDGLVLRHDLRNSKPEKILNVKKNDHEVALYSVHGHPLNGNEFCVGGRDYMVRTYDQRKCGSTTNNLPLNVYHPFKKPDNYLSYHATCAVYNHNGSEILASYNDEDIYLFDINGTTGSFIHQYQGHRNGATIKGVNFFGPKSEYIVSGSDCGNIYFWDRNTESIVQWLLADDSGVVNCLEPHPQLPFICTSGLDWDVKVWVPSYEQVPRMLGLSKTVKENIKARSEIGFSSDVEDTQILWMLWRQLSGSDQMNRVFHFAMETPNYEIPSDNESSSSSNISNTSHSEPDSDDENPDNPAGCAPS